MNLAGFLGQNKGRRMESEEKGPTIVEGQDIESVLSAAGRVLVSGNPDPQHVLSSRWSGLPPAADGAQSPVQPSTGSILTAAANSSSVVARRRGDASHARAGVSLV